MKAILAICFLGFVALARAAPYAKGDICHCAVVIVADEQIYTMYESSTFWFEHDCSKIDDCKERCKEAFNNVTGGGDLSTKPSNLDNQSVGDFGCSLIGMDVNNGTGHVYARLCDYHWQKTDYKFKNQLCCRNGKYPGPDVCN